MEHTIIEQDYHKRQTCGSCNGSDFKTILDLGIVPLAGYFPSEDQIDVESKYPLSLLVCTDCKLVQTDSVINPKLLFEDYRYLSSVGLTNHFTEVADILNEKYDVSGKTITAASSRDKDIDASKANKVEAAKLVGKAIAEKAVKAGVDTISFDRGGYLYHGRVKSLAEGAREGGLKF